jgi:predicted GNAT family N-acyltransferase
MSEDAGEDWLLRFLAEFASMSEEARDDAIDALAPERRDALLALADARSAAAGADLIGALDAGHGGLERLYELSEPADLFAVINLAAKDHPKLLIDALFAAVVVHRGWAKGEPRSIEALREQWIWHVHEQITATRDGEEVAIRWSHGRGDMLGAFAVRERVFYGEQGVPPEEEYDGRDDEAQHLVALEPGGERVIGTLRLLVDGENAKIGRVAVEREWRRRGIASRMLALAVARARELGCTSVRLAAQVAATELYRQAGFAVESDVFEEAGIPHVWMGKALVS